MGYQTDFRGQLDFDKELDHEQVSQLKEFNETRHGGNTQPYPGMPGFWCQWVPTEDAKGLEWDGGEKFYEYVEWLEYLIEHFVEPWGLKLNGEIEWRGEEWDDKGTIVVVNNEVTTKE